MAVSRSSPGAVELTQLTGLIIIIITKDTYEEGS